MEDLQNAISESLPEDEQVESSPTDEVTDPSTEAPEEATSKEAEQEKQVPFHKHPDWIRFQEQKNAETTRERDRGDRLERQLLDISGKLTKEPGKDPYEGLTLEEKAFWQKVELLAENKAKSIIEGKEKVYQQQIAETKQVQAAMIYKKFQEDHPDIKANSPEERSIAERWTRARGHLTLDECYSLEVGPANLEKTRQESLAKTQKKKVQLNSQKQAANLESQQGVSLAPDKKLTVAEFVELEGKKQGLL